MLAARDEVAEINGELDDLADEAGAGRMSAALAARAEAGILARLKAAQVREVELTTPAPLRDLLAPGVDVVRMWKDKPMPARRESLRLLFSPGLCGELRVQRSPTPGHRCTVDRRIRWNTAA